MPEFPVSPIKLEVYAKGTWHELTATVSVIDDYYTDEYLDVFLGRLVVDPNRMPDQELTIEHGRPDWSSQVDESTVTYRLWNEDGYLTPDNVESPWWPDIGLDTPMRLSLFGETLQYGEIKSVTLSWPHGDRSFGGDPVTDDDGEPITDDDGGVIADDGDLGFAYADIVVSNIFRRLRSGENSKPLQSAVRQIVEWQGNLDNVWDYFPMEDGSDATQIASALPGRDPMGFNGMSLAAASPIPGSSPVTSCTQGSFDAGLIGRASSGTWAFEVLIAIPSAPTGGQRATWTIRCAGGGFSRWIIDIFNDGAQPVLALQAFDTAGDQVFLAATGDPQLLFGGDPVTLRLDLTPNGGSTDFLLSWSPITKDPDPLLLFSGTEAGAPGRASGVRFAANGLTVQQGHLFIHSNPLGWLVGADAGYEGETARTRMRRLCIFSGVALSHRDHDTILTAAMGVQSAGTLLDLLRECQDSDGGVFVEERSSIGLKYLSRASFYNLPVTLTLDASANEIANPFAPVWDDQSYRNEVTVTRKGGSSETATDENETTKYKHAESLSLGDDDQILDAAGWKLRVLSWKGKRVGQITIDLGVKSTDADYETFRSSVLALREGDRIQIDNLPPQFHDLADLIIQGDMWTVSPSDLRVTFNCSPAQPWTVMVVGDEVLGRADTAGTTLASGIEVGDTSLSLAFSGARWTTDVAEFPFDLRLGVAGRPEGEVVTVTGITGTTSPQTATVTRGVNGVQLAWDAGTDVRLAANAALAR